VRAGLHFLIPVVVLLWCLMVEELSPGTSAFWATATSVALVIVQPPLLAWMRKTGAVAAGWRQGFETLWKGLVLGARNMIGIGVACASAGLIVGAITLTGMGLMMTDFVELISAGNVLLMLVLTAVICLLIGAGVPTTANYILVATLMAPVIVELGARSDLVIPLIAVHLFVFYFGIMADVTPPVGLASYAAAAISGADPNATGWQATWYSMRTALLPFVFIFNPQILLIGVGSWLEIVTVSLSATVASLLFAAATMFWFRTRCNLLDVALLLVATFLFFRPDYVVDRFYPKYQVVPPARIYEIADKVLPNEWLIVTTEGVSIEAKEVRKTVAIPMGEGKDGREKIRNAGVTLAALGNELTIADVKFGSRARKLGVEQGFKIVELKLPNPDRPSHYWVFVPAILVTALVWFLQGRRTNPRTLR
jgi:TRAP transporter 4TM/12TM fusion protein